jgi:uncharacterized protein (DUF433 family)
MSTEAHPQPPPFNLGVYSLPEAARLVRKPKDWVGRTVKGYAFSGRKGKRSSSPPLFRGQFEAVDGIINLSFRDLIELVFVRDFLDHGVSWPVIRRAAEVAAEWFKETDHPFCVKQFSTDGSRIFARAESEAGGDAHMIDLAQRQHVFAEITTPFIKQLEYSATGGLLRWYPMGKEQPVVLDPRLSFGAPIIRGHGVPTSALYAALQTGESENSIAEWYELPQDAVHAALEYERSLAA